MASCQSREFFDFGSAGYINGEMVVQDGGAHLRSSGAEDLLQWTDAQWERQRGARAKGSSVTHAALRCTMPLCRNCLPKKRFPAIHRPRDAAHRAIFRSQ